MNIRNCILVLSLLPVVCAPLRAQQQQPQEPPGAPPTSPASERPQPPPPPPPVPEVPRQDENTISVEVDGWAPTGRPAFNNGLQTTNNTGTTSNAPLGGKTKFNFGGAVRVPAGKHNTIRVTYLRASTDSSFTAPGSLNLWGTGLNQGDSIDSNYRVQAVNVSFDFLTWPYPPASRRFRLKTLWQVQYVGVQSGFVAPLSTASPDTGSGSKSIILPSLGLGVSYYLTDKARLEANASGFDIPHHSAVGNADAALAYKFGHLELRAGAKLFYFKTSPQSDFYMKGRLEGAFVGVRLYLR